MKYENCVEKQTIEYTHTTVPASMRSPYWKYFGFPSDSANKILTRQKIICTLCGTAITYNKNTSNLRTHLIARHPERLHEMHLQQRQQCSTYAGLEEGDSNDVSTDVLNEVELNEESEVKVQICKRSNSLDHDEGSALKIKRLTSNYRAVNKITLTSDQEDSQYQHENTGNVKAIPNHQKINDVNEHVVVNRSRSGYEFLDSEPVNALTTTGTEDVVIHCADDFSVDTVHNEAHEFVEDEAVTLESEITQKSLIDDSSSSSSGHRGQSKTSSALQNRTSYVEGLAGMLVTDLLPFSVLQGFGFKTLLNSIGAPNVDKYEIEKKVQDDFGQMQDILKKYISQNILQDHKPYSLSIESYINNEEESIASIYVNFLNVDYERKLESVLYEEIVCNGPIDLENALLEFDLSRCAVIVAMVDENSVVNEFATTHEIEVVPCLDALLTRCLDLIFEQNVVLEVLHRIFKLYQYLNLTELPSHCSWSKLKFIKDFLDSSLANDLECQDMASELEPFIAYINPLKITFDTITTESLPLCTLVRPLITKLFEEHFLVFNTEGNVYLESAQKVVNVELRNSLTKCSYFSEAVIFDPRFQHDFIQPNSQQICDQRQNATFDSIQRQDIVAAIKQRFQRLIPTSDTQLKVGQSQQHALPQIVPKSSLRSFFHRISDAAGAANRKHSNNPIPKLTQPESAIDVEFNRYKCESTLDLEQCPISWWQLQAQQYKQLYEIANYYLSVPCYAVRSPTIGDHEETVVNSRSVRWQRRRALRLQHPVEKCLWYLHYNRALCDKIKQSKQFCP
ncbi:PREDICTED: uncharacterized protein LOC108365018 [Rhagoletis zephyria]|uniref:uncharacterized protein LOC108365018 n=1 Tax=Rhagoletis zephyria TaxID=28612 RepID=UPI00081131E3|nr:PREDICTED: uncharacterized protein LOC108365018 [Rhagoletis zephyria]